LSTSEFLSVAEDAARAAGRILQDWAGRFTISEKGPADLVTEADVASQAEIFRILNGHFKDHAFLGEEQGLNTAPPGYEYRWIIDPLDGTSNYVHRFPYYAVSIGLEHRGIPLAGVIHDPTRDETFAAAAGRGATLNGSPIGVSRFDRLKDAMVIASFPPGVAPGSRPIERFLKVLPHAQTIHRSGSAALNLAYVASGRLDAFWSTSLKPWDVAGGSIIVTEAGGRVTKMNGQPLDIHVPDLLCSNGSGIHEELQTLLSGNIDVS
jgi:myo-inositol-1(or 4)-monophosphatase